MRAGCLGGATGHTIEHEHGRVGVRSIPGAIEAKIGIAIGGNCAIVGDIGHRDVACRLGVAPIPKLGDLLSIGEAPGQGPSVDGCVPGIIDRYTGPKATGPLIGDHVVHRAGQPACRC